MGGAGPRPPSSTAGGKDSQGLQFAGHSVTVAVTHTCGKQWRRMFRATGIDYSGERGITLALPKTAPEATDDVPSAAPEGGAAAV